MDAPSNENNNVLFDNFKYVKLQPNLILIDVLGDNVQLDTNSEWRKLGQRIACHITTNNQSAVLLSTVNVADFTCSDSPSKSDNSARFEFKGKTYIVTSLETSQLEQVLPDIIESEEFVFGLNTWLYFFGQKTSGLALCHDERFLKEFKNMILNLEMLVSLELTYELIAAISDGCEMLWFNPHPKIISNDNVEA